MKALGIILTFFMLFLHSLKAQVFPDSMFQKSALRGMDYLYNMDFYRAQTVFDKMKQEYPNEAAPYFLSALNTWWKISISRDFKGYDKVFLAEIDSALVRLSHLEKKKAHAMEHAFFAFNILAFKSRYYAMREEWMTAANLARKALPWMLEGRKYLDQTTEFNFAVGLYDYFAVYYPEKHPVTRPLMVFFPSGNKANGIRLLEKACTEVNSSRNEARFFLMRIYTDDEPDYSKALEMAKFLSRNYPNNTVYRSYMGKLYYLNGELSSARAVFTGMEKMHQQVLDKEKKRIDQIHSLYTSQVMFEPWYYLGRTWQDQQNPAYALVYFRKAEGLLNLIHEKDPVVVADLLFRIGQCLETTSGKEKAMPYYQEAVRQAHTPLQKKSFQQCLKQPCGA
jgi:tetratricopeptide (TPR) repeat protein